MRTFPFGLLLLALGCGGKDSDSPIETETDTDTDADTDTDTDTDTDVDADTDSDPPIDYGKEGLTVTIDNASSTAYGAHYVTGSADIITAEDESQMLVGSIHYEQEFDGVTLCDSMVSLSSQEYTGACEGCDFAFDGEGTLESEKGSECTYRPPYFVSMPVGYIAGPFALAFAPEGQVFVTNYGYIPATNVFQVNTTKDYSSSGSGVFGPYWYALTYDGSYSPSAFSRVTDPVKGTDHIDWSLERPFTAQAGLNDCGSKQSSAATSNFYGPVYGLGSIDCATSSPGASEFVDVWAFEATEGQVAYVSVDTVSDATAFDPAFFINGPDTCTEVIADDSFYCEYTPVNYRCPSAQLDVTTDGTYSVYVFSLGSCRGSSADYRIHIDVQ